jgi:Fe-S-cluster containining protein
MDEIWYQKGLRFSCLQCGMCCWDEGNYTEVYVNRDDIARMAAQMDLYPNEFYKKYVKKSDGFDVLKTRNGRCIMLAQKKCRVYPSHPCQCRSWPFWPQNLSRHVWYGEVRKRCPGVGKGRKYTEEEIEKILLTEGPVS